MPLKNVAVIAALAALVVLIGGGIEISSLHRDLTATQAQLAAAKQNAQKWKASSGQARKTAADTAAARDKVKAEAEASAAKLAAVSGELDQSRAQVAALKTRLAATRADIADAKQIGGYWRDLYDYTKPAPQTVTAQEGSTPAPVQSASN